MSASLMTQIISIQHEMQDQPSFSNPKQKKFKLDNRFTNFPIFNLDEFCFLGLLGFGTFGVVKAAYHLKTKTHFAIKFMKKSSIMERQEGIEAFCNEILYLHNFRDTNYLCTCKGVVETEDEFGIVMPLHAGGELFSIICDEDRLPENCRIYIAAEILIGLEELHNRGYLYRDLKAENVLLSNDLTIRLSDFGFSKKLKSKNERTITMVGTPDYTAPEIIKREEYSFAADIWSYGVLLFELYCKMPPFNLADFPDSIPDKYEQILDGQLSFPCGSDPIYVDLCTKILQPDPERRLTIQEIKEHPFFSNINWGDVEKRIIPREFLPLIDIDLDLPCSNFDPYDENQEDYFDEYFDDYEPSKMLDRFNSDEPRFS